MKILEPHNTFQWLGFNGEIEIQWWKNRKHWSPPSGEWRPVAMGEWWQLHFQVHATATEIKKRFLHFPSTDWDPAKPEFLPPLNVQKTSFNWWHKPGNAIAAKSSSWADFAGNQLFPYLSLGTPDLSASFYSELLIFQKFSNFSTDAVVSIFISLQASLKQLLIKKLIIT